MEITEINDRDFEEVINGSEKVVVDCYAPWCGPCRMFSPVFQALSDEEESVRFCKINTDENPGTAERFNVLSIPTVLVFENGQLKSRETGVKTKEELKALL